MVLERTCSGLCRAEPAELPIAALVFLGYSCCISPCFPWQVVSKELVCKSCLTRTLNKLETMMTILQGETTQGTVTPTGIADNILNITGQLCPRRDG